MDWLRRLTGSGGQPRPNITIDGSLRCSRENTVAELAEILENERIVLARGTPASGKSTLANLLYQYYFRKKVPVVLIDTWPKSSAIGGIRYLLELAHEAGWRDLNRATIKDADIVWIFDEAQMTYDDTDIWLGFVKYQHGRIDGPRICAFSSYGSPNTGPQEYCAGSPLADLGVRHRVSITPSRLPNSPSIALFYTREEFDDVIARVCADYRCRLKLEPEAAEYIFELTSGHPGAVASIMSMLQKVYRSGMKHQEIQAIRQIHITETLDREEDSFDHLHEGPISRSFVRSPSSDAVIILREALSHNSVNRDLDRPGVRECYHQGWLHSEALDARAKEIVLVFPTRLHAKYVERYYTTTAPVLFPSGRFQTIEALAEAALRHFSMAQLSSNAEVLGSGARVRPIEAVYQDEFYRALHKVLRFSTRISSEWTEGSSGRIDFWLPDVKWGIEILRDGDQLGEHCQRFVGNGIYTGWIDSGWLVDWLIIDCRTSKPRKCDIPTTKLWRAVFSEDFSSVEVLDASNQLIFPRFSLMS